MPGRPLLKPFLAGLAGTAAHLLLMFAKDRFGVLPEFRPYDEFQRGLSLLVGADVPASIAWALGFANGALVWSFVFGRVVRYLPGRAPWEKAVFFASCAWLVSGLVFFPLVGRGPFALGLELGLAPAALMAVMLCVYALALSYAWAALKGRDDAGLDAGGPAARKSSDHSGRQ
jgi:hypothetical protein